MSGKCNETAFTATDHYCWFNGAVINLCYLGLEVEGQRETGQKGGKTRSMHQENVGNSLLAQHMIASQRLLDATSQRLHLQSTRADS